MPKLAHSDFPIRNDRQESSHKNIWPERRLARNKILQALQDIASKSNKPEYNKIRREAAEWLFGNGTDLEFWCEVADLDMRCVRRKAEEILEKGLNWRKTLTRRIYEADELKGRAN